MDMKNLLRLCTEEGLCLYDPFRCRSRPHPLSGSHLARVGRLARASALLSMLSGCLGQLRQEGNCKQSDRPMVSHPFGRGGEH